MLVGTLVDALQIAELKATLVPAVVGALQSELTVALVPAAVVRVHLPHCHSEPIFFPEATVTFPLLQLALEVLRSRAIAIPGFFVRLPL